MIRFTTRKWKIVDEYGDSKQIHEERWRNRKQRIYNKKKIKKKCENGCGYRCGELEREMKMMNLPAMDEVKRIEWRLKRVRNLLCVLSVGEEGFNCAVVCLSVWDWF